MSIYTKCKQSVLMAKDINTYSASAVQLDNIAKDTLNNSSNGVGIKMRISYF